MNDTLKVGDRVRIIADCPNKNSGIIISIGNDAAPYCVKDNDGLTWWHDAECLQKITSEEPAMQKNCMHDAGYRCPSCSTYTVKSSEEAGLIELKLEVGKKYVCSTYKYIYIANKKDFMATQLDRNIYLFLNADTGATQTFDDNDIKNLKEHREPYKHNGTYWFVYDDEEDPSETELDIITNKHTTDELFRSKEMALKEAFPDGDVLKIAKIEITAVITEEQNAN